MTRRILVTGATGTVGGAAMRALAPDAAAGAIELLGATRSDAGAARLRESGFEPVAFDYDDPRTLRPALEGVDSIFLVTGYSVDMMIQSKRLLDAAKAARVPHIVHLGALAADDTPYAHFGWHQLIERAIEAMGFSFTHLRPNFFIDTVWGAFRHRPDRVVHFIGDQRVSWISSDDMAAVAAAALREPDKHAGQIYPLAIEALTMSEIAATLSDVTQNPVTYQPRPAASLLPILLKQGMEPVYATSLATGVAAIEAGEMPLAGAVYDTVARVTGRQPITWRDYASARRTDLAAG
ncbi:NmrA family NAD(P)-binding protein [Microvirga antarctica]|uniref:NmrA family NAD(P)-binding protein n=1 Tax=Microvirga antarctica TaxID=2819233 RepID=UPI001B312800|nr:NmrA family NAD(P)-binding protein [Microvirga antarctica]